jgi:hypothetical protein
VLADRVVQAVVLGQMVQNPVEVVQEAHMAVAVVDLTRQKEVQAVVAVVVLDIRITLL